MTTGVRWEQQDADGGDNGTDGGGRAREFVFAAVRRQSQHRHSRTSQETHRRHPQVTGGCSRFSFLCLCLFVFGVSCTNRVMMGGVAWEEIDESASVGFMFFLFCVFALNGKPTRGEPFDVARHTLAHTHNTLTNMTQTHKYLGGGWMEGGGEMGERSCITLFLSLTH